MQKLIVAGSMDKASIQVDGPVKSVAIRGDFVGETPPPEAALSPADGLGLEPFPAAAGNPLASTLLLADTFGKISVGGSVKGGMVMATKGFGSMSVAGSFLAGGLFSGGKIHSVRVRGEMSTEEWSNPIRMMARDGIDGLIVKGDVKNAVILAGYNQSGEPVNPDAHVGKVIVRGNWIQSTLAAGVEDSTGDGFGQNDTVISGDTTPNVVSRIANVIVKGYAQGSPLAGDNYGIVAQQIGRVSIGGIPVELHPDVADSVLLDTTNNDLRVAEVGAVI